MVVPRARSSRRPGTQTGVRVRLLCMSVALALKVTAAPEAGGVRRTVTVGGVVSTAKLSGSDVLPAASVVVQLTAWRRAGRAAEAGTQAQRRCVDDMVVAVNDSAAEGWLQP